MSNYQSSSVKIYVCTTCRNEMGSAEKPVPGERLLEATSHIAKEQDQDIDVVGVECLANCKRRLSAAIAKENTWSYIFGELSIENAQDLVKAAQLFKNSETDVMPWQGRPEILKRNMIARFPIGSFKD